MPKDILVIGSGGREHALAWKLAQSPGAKVYIAPGNGGTDSVAENVPLQASDFDALTSFVKENHIGLTVVGPDDQLAAGIVDYFQKESLRIFGPTQAAAQIESSKAFAKHLMEEEGIPTARFATFTDHDKALAYVREQGTPLVVKASGLALGKGAMVCNTEEQAEDALKTIMVDRAFGDAGDEVVIEEFLEGEEVSVHAFCDGMRAALFPASQDHKQVFDGDKGPNTGGMGAYAPVPWVTDILLGEIEAGVIQPTLHGLRERESPFVGCLYPGLMMTKSGPRVLEFNARLGDPECQVYMRLMKSDLAEVIDACVSGTLEPQAIEWNAGCAVTVALASGGYPGKYKKGDPISGIEEAEEVPGVVVFHAGTSKENGRLVTSGGRVLHVTATGETLEEAVARAYEAVQCIHFKDMHYRKDIGEKALKKEAG